MCALSLGGGWGQDVTWACKDLGRFLPFLRSPPLPFEEVTRLLEFTLPPWEGVGLVGDLGLGAASPPSERFGEELQKKYVGSHPGCGGEKAAAGFRSWNAAFRVLSDVRGKGTLQACAW